MFGIFKMIFLGIIVIVVISAVIYKKWKEKNE